MNQFTPPSNGRQPLIPENVYRRHIERARDAGDYFQFSRRICKLVGKLDAIFLQDLINRAAISREGYKTADGWFMCSTSYLESLWTVKEQEARFRSLVRAGYIKTEKRGQPTLRWVWIDLLKIEMDLDTLDGYFLGGSSEKTPSPPNGGHTSPPNGGANKEYPTGIPLSMNKVLPVCLNGKHGDPLNSPSNTQDTPSTFPSKEVGSTPIPSSTKNTVPVSAATRPRSKPRSKGGKVPFVINQVPSSLDKPRPQQRITTVDRARSQRLWRYAKSQGYSVSRQGKRWADALRILREDNTQDIDAVLDWLISTQPKKPKITDGASFRRCFNWLHDLMTKDVPTLVITPKAKQVVADLQRYGWSTNLLELEQAVQSSLHSLSHFLAYCADVADRPTALGHFASALIKGRLCRCGYEQDFVLKWFDGLRDWLRKKDFRGSLLKLGVSLDNTQFQNLGQKLAGEYDGGRTRLWDELVKEYKP